MKRLVLMLFVVGASIAASVTAQDSNLHALTGTMTSQSCQYFQSTQDWICWVTVFSNGSSITMEVQGQAIGQAGSIGASLPRRVTVTFFLTPAGIDFLRGIVRTQARGYYIYDLGPA